MKHQENKLVTQSGRNRESSNLLVLTSQNAKNSITISPKKVQPFLLLFVIYLYKISPLSLETQRFHKFSYKRDERNHSTSPTLFSKSARCLSLRDSVHMIHLSTNWYTSCEGSA
jgi:hypothetical protein